MQAAGRGTYAEQRLIGVNPCTFRISLLHLIGRKPCIFCISVRTAAVKLVGVPDWLQASITVSCGHSDSKGHDMFSPKIS